MLSSRARFMAAGSLLCALSTLLCAAPALTTIQDVLYKADGTRFNGVLQITWSSFQAADASNIATQNVTVQVTNGYLRVTLVPTTNAASPAAYTVVYSSDGKIQFTEIWVVPPSTAPLRVADVRSTHTAGGSQAVLQMQVADIAGLRTELNIRPTMGSGFAVSRAAVIDGGGGIASATGNLSDCVHVDGSSGPCGSAAGGSTPAGLAFSDGDTPAGLVDGVNAEFTLATTPSPSSSVTLFRNGLALQNGPDFTITGKTVRFPAGNVPQPGDVLQAFYRTASGNGGGGASANATQIQGRAVASTAPSDGQFLGWVEANSEWRPVDANARLTVKADGSAVGSEPALNVVPGNGITQSCVDSAGVQVTCTTSLNTSIALTNAAAQANRPWFCQSTNASTSYACSLPAAALTTYTAGMCLDLQVDTANTGAATLNVDGIGPKYIKQADGSSDPAAGAIVAGQQVRTCFDGNVWRLPRTHTPAQNGMVAWNGSYVNRSIVGTGGVRCVNGDGTAGNPTCSADTAIMQAQNYAADTGVADAYAVALPVVPASLSDGLLVAFKAAHSTTGAGPTMSVNGLPPKGIKKHGGLALSAGDISANGIYELRYESSCDCFQMQSLPGNAPAGSSLTIQDNSGSAVGTRAILQILNGTYLTCTLVDTGSKLTQQCEADTTKLVDRTNANTWTAGAKQIMQASATTAGLNLAAATLPSGPAAGDVAVDAAGALNVYSGSAWQKAANATTTLTSGAPLVGAGANGIGVGMTTGTGNIVRGSAPVLSLPVITDFSNAGHNHTNTAGGGTLTPGAITCASGVFKGGTPASCVVLAAGDIPAALSSTSSVNGTGIPASSTLMTTATAVAKAQTPLTTKGDLWVTDGTNMHRLGVGTNGQVLTADTASTDGMKWAAGGAGSMAIGGSVTSGSEGSILGVSSGNLAQDSALLWDFTNHFQTILRTGLATTSTDALVLSNTTAATAGAQVQYSPRLRWIGQGWKTNATAASQQVEVKAEVVPYANATGPDSTLVFTPVVNGTPVTNGIGICGGPSSAVPTGTFLVGLDGANAQYRCNTNAGFIGIGPVNGTGVFGAWIGTKAVVNYQANGLGMPSTSSLMWAAGGGAGIGNAQTGDVSLDRDAAGVVGVYNGTAPGTTAANYRDMKMRSLVLTTYTAPTCDSTQAGKVQYTAGGAGVADIYQVCAKNAADAWAWVNVGGGGSMTYPGAGIAVSTGTAWGTSKTSPAGAIVGDSDTQTLTNKTVDGVTPTVFGYLDPTSSVQTQLNGKASLASPTFTGTPAAPTAAPGTNTTQLATTAFVSAAVTAAGGGNISSSGTPTANAIPKFTDATHIGNSSILDNGTTVATTEPFTAPSVSTGSTPPTVTISAGNGGVMALGEGTAPTAYRATGVDGCYADSTAHSILCSYNNDTASALARASNNLSFFAATTSAQLAGVLSDETGSGASVFGTNPTILQGSSLSAGAGGGSGIPGSSLTTGSVYYMGASGLALAKADATTTVPGICIAISTTVCAYSGVYKFSATQSWTVGGVLYISAATAGLLTQTAPASTGNQVQRFGIALAADTVLVLPSIDVGGVQ